MNEITKKNDDLAVSNIETGQLAKSRNFLFANFGRRMTATQNILFSLALLHSKVEDGDYAYSTFTREDLEQFITDSKYLTGKRGRILKDMEAVGTNSMLLYDEKMMTDPANGKLTGVLIFASYSYDAGVYSFTFNTSKVLLDGRLSTPILEILKRDEVNPIVYNLDVFSKLTFGGQFLYERILLATNEERRSLTFNLEDLRNLFGAVGTSMQRFDALNRKHLTPAVDSINEFAQIGVAFETIKQSRKIVGVKLFWTLEKVNIPASNKQVTTAHELFVELTLMEVDDKVLLEKLSTIQKMTIGEAKDVISEAIAFKKDILVAHELFTELTLMEVDNKQLLDKLSTIQKMTIGEAKKVVAEAIALKRSILDSKKETIEGETEEDLQKAIKAKQAKEAEKNASQSQNSEPIEVPDFEEEEAPAEEENEDLAIFFEKLGKVSKKTKEDITKVSQSFEADELAGLLEYAYSIYLAQGKTLAFLVKVLQNWEENGIKTLVEAIEFQKVNYAQQTQKQAKKPAKQAKKEPKTNIPHWSSMHPDNADKQENNILAPDFMEKLIETQIAMEIFDKPEGIAEREKRQKEIDEALAKRDELEAKKWELLGRPDTLEEKE